MKLVRYGDTGFEKPGMIDAEGTLRDLSAHVADITGATLGDASRADLKALDPASLPVVEGNPRFGPCVGQIGKFVCIGLNFTDHAEETGNPIPEHPVVFMKATSAVVGPNDDIVMPRGSTSTDWEVELGVVIGRTAKHVRAEEALGHVAGYVVVNDISERAFQLERGGQWTKGKSCDGFAPVGPWLVTPDEVGDPQRLGLELCVNGEVMQKGTTAAMVFPVAFLVSYLSGFMTLHPGDIVATGTPAGVGMARRPPRYLAAGDVVEAWIEGLGRQRQVVEAG